MFKKTRVSTAAALLAGGLLPTLLVPAMAQSTGTTVEKVETVVVTGSRIVRPNLTSSTPVLAISSETMTNLGMENFADMATQLPQFSPAFGSSRTQSTFSGVETSGLNNANLRNLGTNRSLVLINGRRVPGGTSTDTAVDFNSIPTANIERIEVITGGASAIYGADAMGGVINIITKKNFEGVELNVSYSESRKGDNKNPSASLLMGGKFGDAGRASLTLQFDKQGQVSCADREFCKDDFSWFTPGNPIFGERARSGVGANGRFFIGNGTFTRRGNSVTDANGNLIPFVTATDGYNRNGQRDLAIPTKRTLVAGDIEYKLNKNITAFGEFNFANTSVVSNFEGHPFQSDQNTIGGVEASIPVGNPFMPTAYRNAMIAANQTEMTWWQRFSDETMGGNRGATSERTMYRTVLGIKGELDTLAGFGNDWRWEVSSTFGRTRVNLGTEGSVGLAQLYHGLRVEETAPGSGQYQCADVMARGTGCVPINPFAPYTQAMKDYLMVDTRSTGQNSMNDTIASLSGSVFKLPAGDVRVAVGGQYRSLSGYLDHDTQINLGSVTGNQIGDTDFVKIKTKEVFAEILVPVLADKPFINSLNLEGAARHSSSRGKTYDTWKLGGDWEPVSGLRFRAMKARAVRTPVPGELSGIGQNFGVVNDPCAVDRIDENAATDGGLRRRNCLADGIPAAYDPPQSARQSVEGFSGGNANLNPEKGTTWTYGFVFQPSMVKGLSIAVDRFEIRVNDMIKAIGRQDAVDLCYDTTTRAYCDVVRRGTHPLVPGANYVLRAVDEQLKNVATMDIKGVDIDVRYGFKTGSFGDFDLSAIATIYDEASLLSYAGGPTLDLLGQAGGSTTDQGFIKFTANGNIGWKMGPYKANWNIRHIGKADMDATSTAAGFPKIPAHTYHNVRVGYSLNKGTELYAGVTNLFDKKPPLFGSGRAGTQALDTIPGYYDVFGRSFFVGMNAKF